MSDPIEDMLLSSEESEALLAVMREPPRAETADLVSPARRLRGSRERAERVAQDLEAPLARVLKLAVGTTLRVRRGSVDLLPFSAFAGGLATGCAVAQLRGAGESLAFLVLGPRLSAISIERRLGAPLDLELASRLELSPLDRRVLNPLLVQLTDAFGSLWDKTGMTLVHTFAAPRELRTPAGDGSLLRLSMRVHIGENFDEEVYFAIGSEAARSDETGLQPLTRHLPAIQTDKLTRRLAEARVEMVAVLGGALSDVRQVLALKVGDVVRLDRSPDDALDVRIGGVVKLRGTPQVHHGNLAIRVTEMRTQNEEDGR